MKPTTFTGSQLHSMNASYPWNGSIRNDSSSSTSDISHDSKTRYKLYPTGDADATNGRRYVYLPSDLIIKDAVKKKYNLMIMPSIVCPR